MQGRSHSLSGLSAFQLALMVFVCAAIAFLSGGSTTQLTGPNWFTRHVNNRVEQIKAPDATAAPMVSLDARFAEGLHEEVGELSESKDDDENQRCLVRLDVVLRLDVPTFGSQTGLYESPADRPINPFRLRAFSGRGSPLA